MRALFVAGIYFGTFLALGIAARLAVRWWMRRKDLDLSGLRAQVGPSRDKRQVFLLGAWREEGPDR